MKRKLKFKYYKNCLETDQVEIELKHLKKDNIEGNSLMHSLKNITLSAENEKIIQSTKSKEKYPYGTSKGIIRKNEEIKYGNLIKQC